VYVVPVVFGWLDDFEDYRIAAKLSASSMVALSAGLLFLALTRVCSLDAAALLAASYAFGTSAWTVASQALWQHGPAMLCLALALWLALRLSERESKSDAALLSAALAMALLCRPQNAAAAAAIGVFALVRRPRSWVFLLAPAALLLTWQLWYNQRAYHDLRGGYPAIVTSQAHAFRGYTTETVMSMPLAQGLAGLLISPGKGLLVYTPAMLLPLLALPVLAVRRPRSLAPYLLFWVVATLLIHAKNRLWWGGTCYGPRYLLELLIALTFAVGMVWPGLPAGLKVVFGAAVAFGIFAQVVGSLTWECGWHITPRWLDLALDRLWDWRDPEILRCTQVLVGQGPKAPQFGPFAH
jgi:type IV secretory pathway VirB3-like protein